MANESYNPNKIINDDEAVGVFVNRGMEHQVASDMIQAHKQIKQITQLTNGDVVEMLEDNVDGFDKEEDLGL